jgi:hypothetical protein
MFKEKLYVLIYNDAKTGSGEVEAAVLFKKDGKSNVIFGKNLDAAHLGQEFQSCVLIKMKLEWFTSRMAIRWNAGPCINIGVKDILLKSFKDELWEARDAEYFMNQKKWFIKRVEKMIEKQLGAAGKAELKMDTEIISS